MDNNSSLVTKQIIDETVARYKKPVEREDIDFLDIFFPKICAIYGEEVCRMINEGIDPSILINSRGLDNKDIGVIDRILTIGKKAYEEDDSLQSLFDIEKSCDPYLKEYANKVLNNASNEEDRDHMMEVIGNSFDTDSSVYTPIAELQLQLDEVKNNVK